MKILYHLIPCIVFMINSLYSYEEFIYPVAHDDDLKQIIFLHQKSLDTIELLFYDQASQIITQQLSSFCIPANFRMLPTKNGFSFIDQGFIKIKYFNKRSAQTILMYEPISFISSMNWIDEETFYFTAREGDYYQTFQGNTNSELQRLTCQPVDTLYPNKIGDNLYAIKRDADHQCKITMQPWNPIDFKMHQNDKQPETVMVQLSNKPLCFLKMISDQEGFYLQAPQFKKNLNEVYTFSCHHVEQRSDSTWQSDELFSFNIPVKYLHGPERLYESIEPFLPNYTVQDFVYYVDFNETENRFELLEFHIVTKTTKNLTDDFMKKNCLQQQKIFAPQIFDEKIYCGIIIEQTKNSIDTQNNFINSTTLYNTNLKMLP